MKKTVFIALLAMWAFASCKTTRKSRESVSRIDSTEIERMQVSELFAGRNIRAQITVRTYDPQQKDSTGEAPVIKETRADIVVNDSLTSTTIQEEVTKEGRQEVAKNEEEKRSKNVAGGVMAVFGIVAVIIVIIVIITAIR
jgi:hypothetical protein